MLDLPLGPLMIDLAGETITAGEKKLFRHPAVGAVLLFARNYRDKKQLSALVGEIKKIRDPALLVAVDQEGGAVQRFRDGFVKLPAAAAIGELYDRDPDQGLALTAAEAAGQVMAGELLQTGVDFSFAPVLDCRYPHNDDHVIGTRAFHAEPKIVCQLAVAYIDGMNDAGMAATGKHFPGHGFVGEDSHHTTPVDSRGLHELKARDSLPFIRLAPRLGGIMTAHIRFPRIDKLLPAYSPFWLNQVLRQKLNFSGAIFSDDLSMQGATANEDGSDLPQRAAAALHAGCDMALVCNDPDGAHRTADFLGRRHIGNQNRLLNMRGKLSASAADIKQAAKILSAALA